MRYASIGMLLAASLAGPALASASVHNSGEVIVISQADRLGPEITVDASRIDRDTVEVRRSLPHDGERRRRSKGPQAKPRKRSNRQHVSRRTRRRHRRAA